MNIDYSNIKDTFISLTQRTVPHNKEQEYLSDILPNYLKRDNYGNYYYRVGGDNTCVMFTAHLDTVGGDKQVNHVIEGEFIKTDGTSILGADDKAGVALMLYMIHKKKNGLYYFFIGEEVGCVGSRALSTEVSKNKDTNPLFKNIKMVVSLDRKDYDSIITYQSGERCCSDEFANELANRLNVFNLKFKKDEGGLLTDSIQFTSIYPECTNLSVGYFDQHTNIEKQNIVFLEKLANAMCKVDWETLPIVRDPSKTEYKYSSYGNYRGYNKSYGKSYRNFNHDYEDDDYGYGYDDVYMSDYNRRIERQTRNMTQTINGMVIDWRGIKIDVKQAVWCEYDQQWCLRKDAVWEDIVGFYCTPDANNNINTEIFDKEEISNDTTKIKINDIRDIKINDKLYHDKYGVGHVVILDIQNKIIDIEFKNNIVKKFFFPVAKDTIAKI